MNNNAEYIEGIHACRQALDNNVPIKNIFIGNYINLNKNNQLNDIYKISKTKNFNISFVEKSWLDKNSYRCSHQGILILAKEYKYSCVKNIIESAANKKCDLIVVLDHIEDSGNLGAIIRSAEAFGASGIIIPNKRAAQVTSSTYKTSAGAICNIKIARVANISNAIDELKNNEYWIAAASEHTNNVIWESNLKGKIAIVMGSEHNGVSQLILKKSDFIVKLPMEGKIESLNVSQAFCACAYEWVRQNAN